MQKHTKKSPNIGQFAHCEIGVALSQKNTAIKLLDKIILTEIKKRNTQNHREKTNHS
jgi:hypothetical protein